MKKFLKKLGKIIKILLKILLGILIFIICIIIIFNNKYFKLYDGYKITFNESKNINNGYEIYYNLKKSNITFKEFREGNIKLSSNFNMNFNNTDYMVIKMLTYRLLKINLFEKNGDNKLYISGNMNEYYQNNIIEGETIISYEENKKEKDDEEYNATLNHTGYYKNGNIKSILTIKKSSELGEQTLNTSNWFYENGNIQYIENYKNNYSNRIYDGFFAEYYENGQIKEEGFYQDGEKIGNWTGYYENGNIQYTENYKNGK